MTPKERVDLVEQLWLERNGYVLRADDNAEQYITHRTAQEPPMSIDQMLRKESRRHQCQEAKARHGQRVGDLPARWMPIYKFNFPSKRGLDL